MPCFCPWKVSIEVPEEDRVRRREGEILISIEARGSFMRTPVLTKSGPLSQECEK
jgi:hypothetical protein